MRKGQKLYEVRKENGRRRTLVFSEGSFGSVRQAWWWWPHKHDCVSQHSILY